MLRSILALHFAACAIAWSSAAPGIGGLGPRDSAPLIRIAVRALIDHDFDLHVHASDTVGALQAQIEERSVWLPSGWHFTFKFFGLDQNMGTKWT